MAAEPLDQHFVAIRCIHKHWWSRGLSRSSNLWPGHDLQMTKHITDHCLFNVLQLKINCRQRLPAGIQYQEAVYQQLTTQPSSTSTGEVMTPRGQNTQLIGNHIPWRYVNKFPLVTKSTVNFVGSPFTYVCLKQKIILLG